ncbi:MAG: ATP-binding protein [Myxococcota bacterium]
MSSSYQQMLDVLRQHVTAINARIVLDRAARHHGIGAEQVQTHHVATLLPDIERGVALFMDPASRDRLCRDLAALAGERQEVASRSIPIESEPDISRARNHARELCEALGARAMIIQRVATIVSELSRNIISYAERGAIELHPLFDAPQRVRVWAEDQGPGIPNLDEIMTGEYRSRTGLGMGLLGTKRLADHFSITSGARGTRVEAEVNL